MRCTSLRLLRFLLACPLLAACGGGGGESGGGNGDRAPSAALAACGGGSGGDSGAPIAAFTASVYSGPAPLDVTFDASASRDPNGRIVAYRWDFGGAASDQPVLGNRFAAPGTYRVTLTVTDDSGLEASASAIVTALAPGADPLYGAQWHLRNTGQSGGLAGADINVAPVWDSCGGEACRGAGVRIAVVDDGLELTHPDLSANIVNGASYDYRTGGCDPSPADPDDEHGTAVAGLAAARDDNSLGGRGVAPRAELVGYNVLQNPTSANQADAMTRGLEAVDVSTNSWGAPDGTGRLQPSSLTWRTAIEYGLENGRAGRGTIYTWAAGNGHAEGSIGERTYRVDNANYDGQANYHGVIAVGAVDHGGQRAPYSEAGANLWLVAPGGDRGCGAGTLTTTDLTGSAGLNAGGGDLPDRDYTRCMNGTSAAAPLVAGAAALMLQANPALSWRDVKAILAATARRNAPDDGDWTTNGAGFQVNHQYGFGLLDVRAAVALARSWTPLPPMRTYAAAPRQPNVQIPDDGPAGLADTIAVSGSGIDRIEWIDIEFVSDHDYAGDLEITLVNETTGTVSRLSERHVCDDSRCTPAIADADGVWRWRFGSARHFGEAADGRWSLRVVDSASEPDLPGAGRWLGWRLVFRGHAERAP